MFGLLSLLPGVFSTINNITNAISNEKIAAINATTDLERVAAQERVAALQAQRDALIAESNRSKLPIILQTLLALGPAAYVLKYFLWDKVIGAFAGCVGHIDCPVFTTDGLDTQMASVLTAVVGFYLVTSIFRK